MKITDGQPPRRPPKSGAQRQAAFLAREAEDHRIAAEVALYFNETGQMAIPFGLTQDQWEAFIDREEARRERRDAALAAKEPKP